MGRRWTHNVFMAAEHDSEPGDDAGPDWHLQAWATRLGKKQADLVTKLDIHKTTAHRLWTGKQPYRRDFVVKIARWLEIEPYELLMDPDEAVALRRLRETAFQIAAEDRRAWVDAPPAAKAGGKR